MLCEGSRQPLTHFDTDALVIGVYEDIHFDEQISELDMLLQGYLSRCLQEGEIKGGAGEITIVHSTQSQGPKRVVSIGLGPSTTLTTKTIRKVTANTIRRLREISCKRVAFSLLGYPQLRDARELAWAIVEGSLLGHYRFLKYFTQQELKKVKNLYIHIPAEELAEAIEQGIQFGLVCAEETNFSKDVCNEPSNVVTPLRMAEIAQKISQELPLETTILDRDAIQALGMDLIDAVSRGSVEPPYLINMFYRGNPESDDVIGLIGKGLTFDSGGVSLKADRGLFTQKRGLTGGAVAMATIKAAARLNLPLNLVVTIPCAENMPGGRAYKPGDIIPSLSGKKVEIFNTDAEGRLLLADAFTYIQNTFKPYLLIDVATLSGGAIYAIGPLMIPFFSNNRLLARKLLQAGEKMGEALWEFPIFDEYLERVRSHFADVKNDSSKPPQTIVAALFLREFLEPDMDWIHIDITDLDTSHAEYSFISRGATGIAVRSLIRFLLDLEKEEPAQ